MLQLYMSQYHNACEFRDSMVESLQMMWPYIKLVHGRASHTKSQGNVDKTNSDIKKMLAD